MLKESVQEGCTRLELYCDLKGCPEVFASDCGKNQRREHRHRSRAAGWVSTRSSRGGVLIDLCPTHKGDRHATV